MGRAILGGTRRAEVIPAQRRALVLEHIRLKGAASIHELAAEIGASHSTIRRDLEDLEKKGYLERAHGGALLQRTSNATFEPEAAIAAEFSRAQKDAIGFAAAATLTPGEAVIFDSGSTVLAAARAVAARNITLTVVTNDLGTGQVLASAERMRVVIPGGSIRPGSLTLTGEPGHEFLGTLNVDVAFIGIHAISDGYLTDTSLELAAMKRAMIAAGRRVVLLADATKFQEAAFCRVCEVAQIDEVITDHRADPGLIAELREAVIGKVPLLTIPSITLASAL